MSSTCIDSLMHKIANKLVSNALEGRLVSTRAYAITHPSFELVKHFPAKTMSWTDVRFDKRAAQGPWPEQKAQSAVTSDLEKYKESAGELLENGRLVFCA